VVVEVVSMTQHPVHGGLCPVHEADIYIDDLRQRIERDRETLRDLKWDRPSMPLGSSVGYLFAPSASNSLRRAKKGLTEGERGLPQSA